MADPTARLRSAILRFRAYWEVQNFYLFVVTPLYLLSDTSYFIDPPNHL